MSQFFGQITIPSLSDVAKSGIYFLSHEGVVVYVGQAVDARRRIADHLGEGVKTFDSIAFMQCEVKDLDSWERCYIELLLPKYNRCSFSNTLRTAGVKARHTKPFPLMMGPGGAARFLGVERSQFMQWERERRTPRQSRMGSSRARYYHARHVIEFADLNPDLIAAARAQAA